MAELYAVPTAV